MTTLTSLNKEIKVSPSKRKKKEHPSDQLNGISFKDIEGLKITFINMPLRESAKPNVPPLGPALLAARLREYGAIPTIIDLNSYRIKDDTTKKNGMENGRLLSFDESEEMLKRHFEKHGDQDIVALSGMITTLRWQEEICKIIRRQQPDTFLISGGGLATELKDALFEWIPELDGISDSEGDDIILVIARDIKKYGSLMKKESAVTTSTNKYFYGFKNNKPKFSYGGNRPRNLDILPRPAWDLLHEDVYGGNRLEEYITTPVWGGAANNSSATPFTMERSMTSVSSRGCPYACTFCYRGAQGERLYGMRSAENLGEEAIWLKETYDIDFLGYPDDNFAVDKKRIKKMPDIFNDIGIRWGTHTRLDEADQRVIDMAKSGCVYIGFGAESASENVLNLMKKGGFILKNGTVNINDYNLPKTMVDGVRNCRDVGIHSNCTWIMGYPGETLDDLKTSIAFILWQEQLYTEGLASSSLEYQMAKQSVNRKMFTATAYPGTEMFKIEKVRKFLSDVFSLSFTKDFEPVIDKHFRTYVLELDDATKLLTNSDGEPLYFGDMSMDKFVEARGHIDNDSLEKIMDL